MKYKIYHQEVIGKARSVNKSYSMKIYNKRKGKKALEVGVLILSLLMKGILVNALFSTMNQFKGKNPTVENVFPVVYSVLVLVSL